MMQILVNTSKHVDAETDLAERVTDEINSTLSRFSDQITRVEVHLTDQNADKSGPDDLRCTMEARPAGKPPIAVTHSASTAWEACTGALHRMRNLLDSSLGRTEKRRGRDSIRRPSSLEGPPVPG